MKAPRKGRTKECHWLDSKGYSIVMVTCAGCGKKHEQVVANVEKERALKHDIFVCEKCPVGKVNRKRKIV
jgi:hypothetical protein